jgi:regulator of protease activity HflC (stomatin/prohibitin superfamily)
MKKFNTAVAVAVVLVGLFVGGCTTINPGHVGIVVNKFGTNRGVQDYPTRTGFITYNPISTDVVEYPTFTQTVKWTMTPTEGEPADESITFTTKESVKVNADVSLSYQLLAQDVPKFYVKFRNDDIKGFTYGYLHNVVRNSMSQIGGNYTVEQIMGGDAAFIAEVEKKIQSELDAQQVGATVSQFGFIGAPRPPQQIIDSINAAQQAKYNATRTQNELASTVAEAAKVKAQAEGQAAAEVAKAQGQAQANKLLNESLSDKVLERTRLDVEWYRISKWNGVLPQITTGQGNGMLLNIPKP